MTRQKIALVIGCLLFLPAPLLTADTVTLEPLKDNTLLEHPDGALSNGAGRRFFVGRTNQGAGIDRRRGLLAFEVDAVIPPGSVISSVTLQLNMSRTIAGPTVVRLHRALDDWGEAGSNGSGQEGAGAPAAPGDATWLHTSYDTQFWGTPGGDYSALSSASTLVDGEGLYQWTSAAMVADVQSWLDDPASNFGWIVIGDESDAPTAKRFDSRELGDLSKRPKLTISFEPPAGVGACCLPDGSCVVLDDDDCALQGGVYQGDGTACQDVSCPQPTGACCFSDLSCIILAESECLDTGGFYQGDGTDCSTPCVIPAGACCFDDSTCAELTQAECEAAGGNYQGDDTDCATAACPLILEAFVDPLPIPPVLQPVSGIPGGEATYEIPMTELSQQLHRDLPPTTVWGFAGSYPGPTIEAGRDLPVTVNWINDLRDESGELRTEHYLPVDLCLHGPDMEGPAPRTVVHLHGGHVPMAVDGYPEFTFLPGESETYVYPNNQLPATLWYHDHALGITRLNVYMGLAGFYLLRDDFEQSLNLPSGEFEIPLVIQDRTFNADGSLIYPADWQGEFFGDVLLVNGKVWPFLTVKQGKYRLRLLNGSNSRVYTLSLSDGATFQQIGTDGGLVPAPVDLTSVTITPGERADIVVDFAGYAAGRELILQNSAPAPFPGAPGVGVIPEVMKFIVSAETGDTDPLPATLRELEELSELDAVTSRDLVLRRFTEPCAGSWWLINELRWEDVTEYPVLGTIEVWRFVNRSGIVHPMHMHLVMFQVLDRQNFEIVDGQIVPVGDPIPPDPNEIGWKDTVSAPPGQITRVIARFDDYTGLFPYHCHILEHEDHEMMRQFGVVAPCPADIDGSGDVGFTDLLAVLTQWGVCPGCQADIDGDGVVGFTDLLAVLSDWGPCP